MNPAYVPLISAFVGAAIGSLSSIAVILVQAKVGERRERLRQAAQLAMEEYKTQISNAGHGIGVYPFSTFLHHHLAIQTAIEENDLTPERLRKIAADDETLVEVVMDLDRQWREKMRQKRAPARLPNAKTKICFAAIARRRTSIERRAPRLLLVVKR
jgi:hypothetical protein